MIWWIIALCAVPMFFTWTVLHEATHALVTVLSGAKVLRFQPWPHRDGDGKFRFGSTTMDRRPSSLNSVAPYLLDVLAVAGLVTAILVVDMAWARSLLYGISLGPVVNTVVAVQARVRANSDADLSRVHWGWALVFYYLALVYAVLLVLGITAL